MTFRPTRTALWIVGCCLPLVLVPSAALAEGTIAPKAPPQFSTEELDFFEREVRPLLVSKCFACHSDAVDEPEGGLRLDSREAVLNGGYSGPAAVSAAPDESLLIEAIGYESGLDMPPSEPLEAGEQQILRRWVEMGMPWGSEPAGGEGFDLDSRRANHWAWHPPQQPAVPAVDSADWARQPLDRFIQHRLEQAELAPADPASRTTLLRRLHFDLIGLPPTTAEIDAYLADESPLATHRVIERLMAHPQFGVRWGRHWLDVVRYAETYGHEFDYAIPHAWRYRDWVVEALNIDLPYDQFITEQLAGDLLEEPRRDPVDQTNRSLVGSAFWWLGDAVHAPVDVRGDQATRVDNQIDVVSKAMLGMTVACARCHDHKFDAIAQRDYYALSGLLQSTTRSLDWVDPHGRTAQSIAAVDSARAALRSLVFPQLEPLVDPPPVASGEGSGEVVFDFGQPDTPAGTSVGWAMERDRGASYDIRVAADESGQLSGVHVEPSGWIDSARRGDAAVGIWRSAPFELKTDKLALRVRGDGRGEVRVIIDGYFMIDYHQLLFGGTKFRPQTDGRWQWHVVAGDLHHYLGHTAHIELVDRGAGYVGLSEVRQLGQADAPPREPAERVDSLAVPLDETLRGAAGRWLDATGRLVPPREVLASAPLVERDVRLALRGDPSQPGELVPRGDLTALAEGPAPVRNRLDLAHRWTEPDHPLVSRVAVNRLWHHLTGRGLVASCDNFGTLGATPTHPQLLDYLAREFVREEWSMKRSIRHIVHSATYQMDSQTDPRAAERDPTNRLLHAMRLRRLEGEVIRDAALSVAGQLDRRLGGPSVPIHLTPAMTGRGRPGQSGPLDGHGRRSLFVEVRRNFLSPMMLAFDTPRPFTAVGRRNVSNVPAQALVLLNDPLIRSSSARWSKQTLAASLGDDAARVRQMYRQLFTRQPSDTEVQLALRFLNAAPAELRGEAWRELAHALMNVKEFIFLP